MVRAKLQGLALLTPYLDHVAKGRGRERQLNQFASVGEVRHFGLRLTDPGMGLTHSPDRLLDDYQPVGGLEISGTSIQRMVGVFYKKHCALSEGAQYFLAIRYPILVCDHPGEG